MQSFLIIGGDGLIGSSLAVRLCEQGSKVVTTTRRTECLDATRVFFDLAKKNLPQFDIVTHAFLCAGITNVNSCEADPENTTRINVTAILELSQQLLRSGCRIIFISSNTVFNGKIKNPNEDAEYSYANEYGRQKAEVERQLLAHQAGVTIVRITKVVSYKLSRFATIFQHLKMGQPCEVFNDLFFCPISLDYLCHSLISIATSNLDGIFHVSGAEDISYANFASHIADYLNVERGLVRPIASGPLFFKPQYAGLGMQKTIRLLNIYPESLKTLLNKINTEEVPQ